MQRKCLVLMLGLLLVFVTATANAASSGGFGGGGPIVGGVRLNLDGLNKGLKVNGFDTLNGDFLFFGGGGSGGTLYWTVGGWGMGGEATSTNGTKEASLTLSAGGFNVQRTIPIGPIALSSGFLIGGGSAELRLVERTNPTFEEVLANRYDTVLTNDFFAVIPTAGIRIKLTDFMFIQAEGGYLATLGGWKFQEKTMTGAGLPVIGGPVAKIGLVFGGSSK